jgi:uncharacterized repeat protein (TIGR03803 family)
MTRGKPLALPLVFLIIIIASTALAAVRETVLHSFHGTPGRWPYAGLISDSVGNFYGVTRYGPCSDSCGVAFELQPVSNGYKYKVLHVFDHPGDGSEPNGAMVLDAKGNLYGTTVSGGANSQGIVYELSPTQSGTWKETILHGFQGGSDGSAPEGALIFDQAGDLYGTTLFGGGSSCGGVGCGTVFELSPSGGAWNETILHAFNRSDGQNPWAAVEFGADGNLYGTTEYGGDYNIGTVFQLSSSGGGWTEKVLYSFTGGSDGSVPASGVTFDSAGNLYSTAAGGGNFGNCSIGCGTVFELSPHLDGTWSLTTLYAFSGADGQAPNAGVIFDTVGNLYGTTFYGGTGAGGIVYKLSPAKGRWTERILYDFTRGNDGYLPSCDLIRDAAGTLYGTTAYGGTNDIGTVFKLHP